MTQHEEHRRPIRTYYYVYSLQPRLNIEINLNYI